MTPLFCFFEGITLPEAWGVIPSFCGRKEGYTVEKRHEYADGEIITCPKCGSDGLEPFEPSSVTPDRVKCNSCGLIFTIRQVAVWEE